MWFLVLHQIHVILYAISFVVVVVIIIIIILLFPSFLHQLILVDFNWSVSDS